MPHFQKKKSCSKGVQIQKKNLEDKQVDREEAENFMLNTPTKTREKVKINGKYFRMQVDTGSDITLIPVNFWQDLGKPRLKKSALQLKQFNGTVIKTLGTFKGTFETKNRFEIIPITVVVCIKDHGLLAIDVLKVDTLKLVNSMEPEEQEIGLLKGYKASICLKENYHPRYIQARRLPIYILPIVVSKLKKNDSAGYFGKEYS